MSKLSARSKPGKESGRQKNYKLFAVNFHGSTLDSIREEYIRQVKIGLRRNVFVVDLEEEMRETLKAQLQPIGGPDVRKTRSRKEQTPRTVDMLSVAQTAIEKCRSEYERITKIIENELKFDILHYWEESTESGDAKNKRKPSLGGRKPQVEEKPAKGKGDKTGKKLPVLKESELTMDEIVCQGVFVRPHNKVGNREPLSKRKYIRDEPLNSKLYILLLGKFNNKLYLDLLSRGEPLQAIVHFVPQECAYDILIPQPRYQQFLRDTMTMIQNSIYELRQEVPLKPVGMFQEQLPVISRCLARHYAQEIFNELTWFFYDIEVIFQQYMRYYITPFHETNVAMDAKVNMLDLLEIVESLSLQGHFLLKPMPVAATDLASIVMFLESIISTVEQPEELPNEFELMLLSIPFAQCRRTVFELRLSKLISDYQDAFYSITKFRHYERLVVEDNNALLQNMISYMDLDIYRNIYLCCLEYHIMRPYIISPHVTKCVRPNMPNDEYESLYLPPWCKFYSTHDSVMQRLTHLLDEYENYDVDELYPGYELYHFRRNYNEIVEHEKLMILPSRLCFRDFTLFQLEEFVENLVTPEMRQVMNAEIKKKSIVEEIMIKLGDIEIDPRMYIRPGSLKARKLGVEALITPVGIKPKEVKRKLQPAASRKTEQFDDDAYVGLPPNHALIKGYNLEDIRQEINIKTATYYFEEGSIKLYEERWCFDDMNKNMHLDFNKCAINLLRPREPSGGLRYGISSQIHIRTRNDVTCRILGRDDECAKVVVNYPNGLAVYYHTDYAEQLWYPQETFSDERRRVFTPQGAVIVHYKDEDVIRVLRHNGEVYELFQHPLDTGEEEEMDMQQDWLDMSSQDTELVERRKSKLSVKESKRKSLDKIDPKKKRKSSLKSITEISLDDATSSKTKPTKTRQEYLKECVENELTFLHLVSVMYSLSYVHLKVTTSTGRIIQINHRNRVYESRPVVNMEWHDYFANESYSMRRDGVKMIWTKDSLKCFHVDGTILITKTDEGLENAIAYDEFAANISESSSHEHLNFPEEEAEPNKPQKYYAIPEASAITHDKTKKALATENLPSPEPKVPVDVGQVPVAKPSETRSFQPKAAKVRASETLTRLQPTYKDFITTEEQEEDFEIEDTRYVTYRNHIYQMQHKCYACVNFTLTLSYFNATEVEMEILTADDIKVRIMEFIEPDTFGEEGEEEELTDSMDPTTANKAAQRNVKSKTTTAIKTDSVPQRNLNISVKDSKTAQEEPVDDIKEEEPEPIKKKFVISVHIGPNVELQVTDENCLIRAIMERYVVDEEVVKEWDTFEIIFDFDEDICKLFHKIVQSIADFKNYQISTFRDLFFLGRTIEKCHVQGFEFIENLKIKGEYYYEASNTVVELIRLKTIAEKMSNIYEWYEKDLKKFPRFPKRPLKKKELNEDFPWVMSTNIYCKIPAQLMNSQEIAKFVEPFETITFKRTRNHIKQTLDNYLKPHLKLMLKRLISAKNWRQRHIEHRRRILVEEQRKGLYHAMLKHKVYPKYHLFVTTFRGHVRYIDFFDFMKYKCMVEKPVEPLAVLPPKRNKFF